MIRGRTLNTFLTHLGRVCQNLQLDEKWLLVPSLRVGHQWLDSLTLHGIPVVNCRLFTIPGMAMRFAAPVMSERGLSSCNEKGQLFLVDSIIADLSPNSSAYFSKLLPGLSLIEKVCAMLNTLQLAGIEPDDIDSHHFESDAKYADVVYVFRAYIRRLQEMKLVDYCHALKIAADSIRNSPSPITKDCPFFIIPTELELCELEKRLLEGLPVDKVISIAAAGDEFDSLAQHQSEQERIGSVLKLVMEREPQPRIDFFAALGEGNEVREILRRCFAYNIPFDEVEIVHTDIESYIPAIYETVHAVSPKPIFDWSTFPVTFADGISTRYSRPGRALQAWIEWTRNDFPQAKLVHLVEDGLLDFGDEYAEDSHFLRFGQMLRTLVIVNGQNRYLPALREPLERTRKNAIGSKHEDLPWTDLQGLDSAYDLLEWQTLNDFVERLLKISAIQNLPATDILDRIRTFISECVRCTNEMDNYARLTILKELDSLQEWMSDEAFSVTFDILEWAKDLPNALRILGSRPRPGCLHVSHIMNGGHSGRSHLFIVGLDQERFPGSPSIDPLMLDEERQKISDHLPTSSKNHDRKLLGFVRLLARQTGNICFSYSSADLIDGSSYLPSSVFQAAWDFCHTLKSSSSSERSSDVLSPVSFIPAPQKSVCTTGEWWLQRILGDKPMDKESLFERFFPPLWQGLIASKARESDVFTEYDGHVADPGCVLDPTRPSGPVLSIQKLETFARCPRSYFFNNVLSVKQPNEPWIDVDQWLNALEVGSILHEIFRVFIEEVMSQGKRPLFARDHPRLRSLLRQYVDLSKSIHPPPSMRAFHRQLRMLEGAADIFLVEEEIAARSLIPRFVEVSIGLQKTGTLTAVDRDMPEALEIEPGVFIRVQGRVDRIDESVEGDEKGFVVWDYKTGGPYQYQRTDLFYQGRNLQHAIYAAIVAALLKRRLHPKSRVSKFGYYFPSLKGRGQRIVTVEDPGEKGMAIVRRLCRMISRGCFPATNNAKEDCEFCEYAEVCGDTKNVAWQSHKKIANEQNDILEDFRVLRGVL